jgi:hypothetical protein
MYGYELKASGFFFFFSPFFFTSVKLHHLEMGTQVLLFLMQRNYFNRTCMWPDGYQIIDYSTISDVTYTDVSSYR